MSTLMRPLSLVEAGSPAAPDTLTASPETCRAALHDVVQPWALDISPFVPIIVAELSSKPRPTMIELGCGTGGGAWQIMRDVPSLIYHGYDDSSARLHRFTVRARGAQSPAAKLTGPIDLTRKVAATMLQQAPKADVVLMNRFLQTVPPMVPSTDFFTRAEMLRLAKQMVRPGGSLMLIEDVYGTTAEEHRAAMDAWDDVIYAGAEARVDYLREVLPGVSPDLLKQLELKDRVGVIKTVRQALNHWTERAPMPWASWQFLFDQLGMKHRLYRHPALASVWLIRVDV